MALNKSLPTESKITPSTPLPTMTSEKYTREDRIFYTACGCGDLDAFAKFYSEEAADKGQPDHWHRTPLIHAVICGRHQVVALLVSGHQVNVNQHDRSGMMPLLAACMNGAEETVKLLCQAPNIDLNKTNHFSQTALWAACREGTVESIEMLMAASQGRLDMESRGSETLFGWTKFTPMEIASKLERQDVVALLQEYKEDPTTVSRKMRLKHMMPTNAAELFALAIFLCDGFLDFHTSTSNRMNSDRFLHICAKLPLEIQLVLVNRTAGSTSDTIHFDDRELAFHLLAKYFIKYRGK